MTTRQASGHLIPSPGLAAAFRSQPGHGGSLILLLLGFAWPYLVASAWTIAYCLCLDPILGFDLPDPPWWSARAALTMAFGVIPLVFGIYGRLPADGLPASRLRRCLSWSAACVLVNAIGLALYLGLLNMALSLFLV